MTRKDTAGRHGSTESSGGDSWRSQDTVKGSAFGGIRGGIRGTPSKLKTYKKLQLQNESEISPGSGPPNSAVSRDNIAPWENAGAPDFSNFRKDLGVLETSAGNTPPIPSVSRQPPTSTSSISPWTSANNAATMSSSVFSNFYNNSQDNVAQLSPGFRPRPGDMGFPDDDRRPSVASVTTVSSTGSKSSIGRNLHKKLTGFFGEEYEGRDSRQNSESSLPISALSGNRNRTNSLGNTIGSSFGSRPASPTSSRPRTPLPSSEVTPWVFQNHKGLPDPPETQRLAPEEQPGRPLKHKLHLPGHRHHRSREEAKPQGYGQGFPLRPTTTTEGSTSNSRRTDLQVSSASSAMSSRVSIPPRSSSPTSSINSTQSREPMSQKSPGSASGHQKRSLLDRVTRRHKNDRPNPELLKDLPASSGSLQQPSKAVRIEVPPAGGQRMNVGSISEGSTQARGPASAAQRKEHLGRLPFKNSISKRGYSNLGYVPQKDPRNAKDDPVPNPSALWNLDTDLSHMEGIVDRSQPLMTPPVGTSEIYTGYGWPGEEASKESKQSDGAGGWAAPDSWASKRVGDENMGRLSEIDENGIPPKDDDTRVPYHVRIFRPDSTFNVVSVGLNTTVAEIIHILGKKTFLQDELENYQIIMRKHDTSRQLSSGERPLIIQKRLLEQAGYTEADRIEEIGREDNSYLCRFTFMPAKMSGFSTLLERDPGFSKMQKFSHVDLSGRNLITIPITLYQKATEIISLNLSRNLSLEVPKDFIQGCTNLREIKYNSNEAWRLPPSLSLASKLTMLDVSNNRLEQLEHAELNKLQYLISLRLSNNKLSSLPDCFGAYKSLRSLNLSSNSLSEFPDFLCDVGTLVDLDISFNSISNIPKMGQLTCLERLWATNNKLSGAFPPTFGQLTNLKEIDIRFNAIDNIDVMSQLPHLETLMVGHNSISAFEGSFAKIKVLYLNHNPVTRFGINASVPSLSTLNIASAKLAQLPDDLFQKLSGLTKLILDKNHFVSLSPHVGKLTRLEHLSIAKNLLDRLPPEIGHLGELRYLDVRENNLNQLPSEIWYTRKLETLNVSSNVLADFPKPMTPAPGMPGDGAGGTQPPTPGLATSASFDELGKLEGFATRRPSQASGMLSVGSSPSSVTSGLASRKESTVSTHAMGARKPSLMRTTTEGILTPVSRKDSTLSNRIASTFAGSLRHLLLADNRLSDDVFDELALLPELRIVNLSYNELYDIPPRTIRRWQHLTELYLSGNDLTSLPSEDLEDVTSLKVLHINSNKFQVLPAELGKVTKLAILDVGSNMLKYNVSNWPYDWNWNWNRNLKYLNLSGNKRLEIKPSGSYQAGAIGRDGKDLTDFSTLNNLRILGLMDVTLMIRSVPDQAADRRVRTSGSLIGNMAYGMADSLGRNEHLSTIDMVVPRYRGHEDEAILGMFDGQALSSGGSKIAKFLQERFACHFGEELDKLRPQETPADAFRRTYLTLNKELSTTASQSMDAKEHAVSHRNSIAAPDLGEEDLKSGSVATVIFLRGMELFVSNVGDAQALLIHSEGGFKVITRKHDPAEPSERQRIREAGGFVSRQGKLNDVLEVSRAFGYIQMSPSVIAAPHVSQISIRESDEIVLLASRELWDYLTPDFAVDVARSERGDLMRAAQKLRDLAIAFGATSKIMVMMIGVSDLRKRERARFRTHSMSMGPTGSPDEYFAARRGKRGRDAVGDSKLARLDQEVDAPVGDVSLVFTDIKSSTLLWETYPIAMRSAIKMHNEVMRRHLRIIGGYEVKTEGDAFMVAFPTVTSALLWCFTIQSQLLDVQWPQEILSSVNGQEVQDSDGNVIFRGLSVRMGIHWGQPVCEVDPVTKRMDYFGPMVNRAARISAVADGGQITVSSDYIAEIQRLLETHIESDRSGSTGSDDTLNDDMLSHTIRRELRSLSSQGFEVKDIGQRSLKGLENPEHIYLMYPHSLASRLVVQQQRADAEAASNSNAGTKTRDSQLTIDTEDVWELWNISLRLEMLCSTLECPGTTELKAPETALLERMKNRGGEITDRFLINFVEHQVSRIESCITSLALRNLIRPFRPGRLFEQACPMADILSELTSQLAELKAFKEQADFAMAPS